VLNCIERAVRDRGVMRETDIAARKVCVESVCIQITRDCVESVSNQISLHMGPVSRAGMGDGGRV
jgi:hypothetical protein